MFFDHLPLYTSTIRPRAHIFIRGKRKNRYTHKNKYGIREENLHKRKRRNIVGVFSTRDVSPNRYFQQHLHVIYTQTIEKRTFQPRKPLV